MKSFRLPLLALLAAAMLVPIALSAQALPKVGERYQLDGRCVTVIEVYGGDVFYEWRDDRASGNGHGPLGMLGPRCGEAAAPAAASAATPPRRGSAAVPPGDFQQQILQAHNRLRCMHNVPPLQWNAELAAYAQRWVNRGVFEHSDSYRSPLGLLGENLFESSPPPDGQQPVQAWYAESQGYDYSRVRQAKPAGHFTALIWQGARFVGCARAGGMVSCNYAAAEPQRSSCEVPNFNLERCALQQVLPPTRSAQACR